MSKNEKLGLILTIASLIGLYYHVDYCGWVLTIGLCFIIFSEQDNG